MIYELSRPLGGGRFSRVYEARGDRGRIAYKVARAAPAPPSDVTDDVYGADGVAFHTGHVGPARLTPNEVVRDEAATLARVSHPAFVKLLDEGESNGSAFMVLELIEGQTFRAGKPELLHVREVVEALSSMPGFVHGDIKADNLMLDVDGKVRIIDPSSGSWRRDERMLLTSLYNPFYQWSDVPALGFLLGEIVTGTQLLAASDPRRPARRITPKLEERLNLLRRNGGLGMARGLLHMPLPRELAPGVGEEIQSLILRCLGLAWDGNELDLAEQPKLAELHAKLAVA